MIRRSILGDQMIKQKLSLSAVLLLLVLSACNLPNSGWSDEKQAEDIQTSAAETVNAKLTENASLIPSDTPTTAASNTIS